jgi:hypothetical protein
MSLALAAQLPRLRSELNLRSTSTRELKPDNVIEFPDRPEVAQAEAPAARTTQPQEGGQEMAQALLQEGSDLAQASVQFEMQRGPENYQYTPGGQKRRLKRAMTKMAETEFHQQSGLYPKEDLGQMLSVLNGPNKGPAFAIPRPQSTMGRALTIK